MLFSRSAAKVEQYRLKHIDNWFMAYLPGFKHDIFISYAHLNNPSGDGGAKGWVTRFHDRLEIALQQLLGERVIIWRDLKLGGNDLFDQKIEQVIKDTGLFIGLNSNAYMNSEYCQQELEQFYAKAEQEEWGVEVDGRMRIINVMLNNISHEKWPAAFKGTTGYKFYKGGDDGLAAPVNIRSGAFGKDVESLAVDLAHTLRSFRNAIQPDASHAAQVSVHPAPPQPKPRPWWRRKSTLAAVSFLILSIVAIGAYLSRRLIIESVTKEDNDVVMFIAPGTGRNIGTSAEASVWPRGDIDEACNLQGRRIKGEMTGLFKTAVAENKFNLFDNFIFHIKVSFVNGKGVAWIVRAKDFDNYYLFKLTTDKSESGKRELNFYICREGKLTRLEPVEVFVPMGEPCNSYDIYTLANGGNFRVFIRPFIRKDEDENELLNKPDSGPVGIGVFHDDTFPHGGVGFRPMEGMDILLQQMRAMPSGTEEFKETERNFPHV